MMEGLTDSQEWEELAQRDQQEEEVEEELKLVVEHHRDEGQH